MIGETIEVLRKTQKGTDSMGEPTYEWVSEQVQNCLVRPLQGADLTDALRPDGVRVSYVVAFPKSYTGRSTLRGCKVAFPARSNTEPLWVSGSPDITSPCPTEWDTTAEVGRVDG